MTQDMIFGIVIGVIVGITVTAFPAMAKLRAANNDIKQVVAGLHGAYQQDLKETYHEWSKTVKQIIAVLAENEDSSNNSASQLSEIPVNADIKE